MKQTLRLTLLAVTTIALTACSSTHSTPPPLGERTWSSTHQQGVPGGIWVETLKLSATVTAIDAASRKVTLATPDGRQKTLKCGPEVINFDQLQVGDHIKATVTSELTLAMANAGDLPADTGTAQVVLAPRGARPGGIMTETQEYTATVTAINRRRRTATLRFPDDTTRTFAVREDIDLSQRKVGEKVAVRVTVEMVIAVEKQKL